MLPRSVEPTAKSSRSAALRQNRTSAPFAIGSIAGSTMHEPPPHDLRGQWEAARHETSKGSSPTEVHNVALFPKAVANLTGRIALLRIGSQPDFPSGALPETDNRFKTGLPSGCRRIQRKVTTSLFDDGIDDCQSQAAARGNGRSALEPASQP